MHDTSGQVAGMPNIVTRNANLVLPQRHLGRLGGRPMSDRQQGAATVTAEPHIPQLPNRSP